MKKWADFILLHFVFFCSHSSCLSSAQNAAVFSEDDHIEVYREACRKGDVHTIVALINEGRSVDERLYGRSTPLHCAVYYGHISAVLTLISAGADEQSKTFSGLTPFHIASILKNAQMLEILSKPSYEFKKDSDWSKEHLAAFFDDIEVLKQLNNNSVEIKTTNGVTPLFAAVLGGSEASIDLLLERGADLAIRTECGSTIVHAAAASGSVKCLKMVLSKKIDFKTEDDDRRQPLHYAAAYGAYDTTSHLLTLGSRVDVSTDLPAQSSGDKRMAYNLKEDGKGNYHNPYGVHKVRDNPAFKSVDLITRLLDNDDPARGTPMFCALRGGSLPIVKLLFHHNASINDSYADLTSLMVAAGSGHLHLMKFLFESMKKSIRTSVGGITALHCAAAGNSVVCIDYCLDKGIDPEEKDLFGRTPLQYAVLFRAHKSLGHLLAKGVKVTPCKVWQTNSIVEAVARGDHVAMDMLISRGANTKYKLGPHPDNQNMLLLLAVLTGSPKCVQRCLESGISTECGDYVENWKPIHEAARRGDAESMKLLIDAGAKISCRDDNGKTPLYLSIRSGSLDCVKLCVAAGAKLNRKSLVWGPATPLSWAMQLIWIEDKDTNTSVDMFKLLLASGASVEVRDDRKKSPLMNLVGNLVGARDEKCDKYLQMIELLFDAGAYLWAKDRNGTTLLDCVLRRCRPEDLQFFASKSILFFRPSLTDVVLSGQIVNAALGVFWLLRVKNSSLQNLKVYPQLYILTSLSETSDDLARVILYELTRKSSEKPFIPDYLTQMEKRVLLTSSEAKEAVVDYLIHELRSYCSKLLDSYAQSRHLWQEPMVPVEYSHLYMSQERSILLDPELVGERFRESIERGLNDRWALLTERINEQHDTSEMHFQQKSANCVIQ